MSFWSSVTVPTVELACPPRWDQCQSLKSTKSNNIVSPDSIHYQSMLGQEIAKNMGAIDGRSLVELEYLHLLDRK